MTTLKDDAPALTVTAHTGQESRIVSTRGAFSFRIGNLFAGQDKEVLHVSEQGNLSVPGTISAVKGIEFADGTVQTSGLSGRKDKDGNIVPNASGTGTQNRLAKWTDNAGTLGDSVAIDTGTGLQLTVPASSSVDTNVLYTIGNDRTTGVIASSTPSFLAQNGPYFALRGNTYSAIANQRGLFSISTGNVTNPVGNEGSVLFLTGADQPRMIIKPGGNVGIGTTSPGVKLDIQGSVSTFNGVALALTNANGGNTNPWVLGTGGRDVAKDAFSIGDSSSYKLTILANGNVGINTITPQAKLDVNGNGSSDIALRIANGGIQVAGAGINASTPVFTHQATAAGISACGGFCTEIDHPLTNGNPNAILIVTQNSTPGGNFVTVNPREINVFYDTRTNKWGITNSDETTMPTGAAFNVLVVKP